MHRSRVLPVMLVMAFGLAAAACGGGGSDSSSSSNTSASDTKATTSTTASSSSGSGGGGSFASTDCRQLSRAFDQRALAGSLASGDDPTKALKATADFLDNAADNVPDAVSADVAVLADAYRKLADKSGDVDWKGIRERNPAALLDAAQLGRALATPEFAKAAQNLSSYVSKNCTGS